MSDHEHIDESLHPHSTEGNGIHRQVKVPAPDWVPSTEGVVELDEGIVPVVTALWRLGATTYCSCQGDPWESLAWVAVTKQRAARVIGAAQRADVFVIPAILTTGVKLYFDPDDHLAFAAAIHADVLRYSDDVDRYRRARSRPIVAVHLPAT